MKEHIRNFCIIAHIDHGKSTLADQLLLLTRTVEKRKFRQQYLDSMDLEREKGITIKAHTVTMQYGEYVLNLIDTPGHVDFSYEVSRALAACEGAILLVDAAEGVQAQTIANLHLALRQNLVIIPVINKIDLPRAEPERVFEEITALPGLEDTGVFEVSARTGKGINDLLDAVVEKIPAPEGRVDNPLKALIFDSVYDSYRGVRLLVRVFEGKVAPDEQILSMAGSVAYEVEEVGIFSPEAEAKGELRVGEVGYIYANIKNISEVRIGDTLTCTRSRADSSLPGYKKFKPLVFLSFYPSTGEEVTPLREALGKLSLNDPSFTYRQENSSLGAGFHCGFLGSLHAEIIRERLEREFDLDLVSTAPRVTYRVITHRGETLEVEDPRDFPNPAIVKEIREPWVRIIIIIPTLYLGPLFKLLESRRGEQEKMEVMGDDKTVLVYHIPLSEMLFDFFDRLKSLSSGYATIDYEDPYYRATSLVKMDIYLNREKVDAFSLIVHRDEAYWKGRQIVERIKEIMPPQQFPIAVKASVGNKIIARADMKVLRKDVIAPLYGGDVTRKRKLLEKQKKGKKRLKEVGKIKIPQEVFSGVFRKD